MKYITTLVLIGLTFYFQAWISFTVAVFVLGCQVGEFFTNFKDREAP